MNGGGRVQSDEHRCPWCGSTRWVSASADGGHRRLAQCVPCGAMGDLLGPGAVSGRTPSPVRGGHALGCDLPDVHPLQRCSTVEQGRVRSPEERHDASVEPSRWQAACICGWEGPHREYSSDAHDDLLSHKKESSDV